MAWKVTPTYRTWSSRTVTEWSKVLGVPRKTIWTRLYKGWSDAMALGLESV